MITCLAASRLSQPVPLAFATVWLVTLKRWIQRRSCKASSYLRRSTNHIVIQQRSTDSLLDYESESPDSKLWFLELVTSLSTMVEDRAEDVAWPHSTSESRKRKHYHTSELAPSHSASNAYTGSSQVMQVNGSCYSCHLTSLQWHSSGVGRRLPCAQSPNFPLPHPGRYPPTHLPEFA